MISLHLLRVLFRSTPDHPLFLRRYFQPRIVRAGKSRPWYVSLVRWLFLVAMVLTVIPAILSVGAIFLFVLAGATIAGAHLATGIAANVRHEYDDGRFEVISTTPAGGVGLCTLLAIRFVRTNTMTLQIRRLLGWVYGSITAATVVLGLVLMLTSSAGTELASSTLGTTVNVSTESINQQMFVTLFSAWSVIVFMFFDLMQSTVLGVIIGIVVPHLSRGRKRDAGLTAFGVFLTLQIGLYVIMVFGALIIPAALLTALKIDLGLGIIPIQIGIALGVREALIAVLWRFTCGVLNTDLPELYRVADLR